MQLSPEMEARFAENRLKKFKIEHDLKNGFWAFLILGVIIFGSALFAGASSAMTDNKRGPMIFYTAFASGLFQILLGIGTIIAGTLNYRKIRIAGLIYLGIAVILLINRFMHIGESLAIFNIIFLLIAIGLSVWIQTVFNKEDLLKEEPGYPLFSPEASFAAKYEAPLHVRMAKASDHMETIGAPPAPAEAAAPAIPAVPAPAFGNVPEVRLPNEVRLPSASDFGLSAELGSGSSTPAAVPQISGDVTLDSFAAGTGGVQEQGVSALPQVSAEDLLMDMTAVPSHATIQGDASKLPSPDEVRARLAAMKRARDEHTEG